MITYLQEEIFTKLDGRYIARRLKQARVQNSRLLKAGVRSTRRAYLAWYRQQYFLSVANKDLKMAVRRNEDIFIAVVFAAAVLSFACAVIAAEMVIAFFLTAFTASEVSGINILIFALIAGVTLTTILAWVAAFLLNSMSLAIIQGANRHKIRSLRSTLRQGLRMASRTATSWLMLIGAIALPAAAVSLAMFVYTLLFADNLYDILAVAPYAIIFAAAGAILMLLHYSLVPVVALFETKLSWRQVFARSRQLVYRRGKMFVLAAYGFLAIVLSAAYVLYKLLYNLTGLDGTLLFSLIAIVAVAYFNGIMTVFYRKRRLVRSR
ncbi:hypothetical protein KY385_00405 [Candidatus Parcubacteria bacterium]|nr:hypothetical protein [Candidatus Parcubacteria bacterium]